jgi:hypothetical protein
MLFLFRDISKEPIARCINKLQGVDADDVHVLYLYYTEKTNFWHVYLHAE